MLTEEEQLFELKQLINNNRHPICQALSSIRDVLASMEMSLTAEDREELLKTHLLKSEAIDKLIDKIQRLDDVNAYRAFLRAAARNNPGRLLEDFGWNKNTFFRNTVGEIYYLDMQLCDLSPNHRAKQLVCSEMTCKQNPLLVTTWRDLAAKCCEREPPPDVQTAEQFWEWWTTLARRPTIHDLIGGLRQIDHVALAQVLCSEDMFDLQYVPPALPRGTHDLIRNEIYVSTEREKREWSKVIRTCDSERIGLSGEVMISVTINAVQISPIHLDKLWVSWPLQHLREYGVNSGDFGKQVLTLVLGRASGEFGGTFKFQVSDDTLKNVITSNAAKHARLVRQAAPALAVQAVDPGIGDVIYQRCSGMPRWDARPHSRRLSATDTPPKRPLGEIRSCSSPKLSRSVFPLQPSTAAAPPLPPRPDRGSPRPPPRPPKP